MTDNRAIELLKSIKDGNIIHKDDISEAVDIAIAAIVSKQKIIKQLDSGIDNEKSALDQINEDFNHHLWIMRGLQIAKAIVEGGQYKYFTPSINVERDDVDHVK